MYEAAALLRNCLKTSASRVSNFMLNLTKYSVLIAGFKPRQILHNYRHCLFRRGLIFFSIFTIELVLFLLIFNPPHVLC